MTIDQWLAKPLEKDTIREMHVVHRGGDQYVAVMLDECWVKYYHDPTTKTVFEAEAKTLKHAISKIERKLARLKG